MNEAQSPPSAASAAIALDEAMEALRSVIDPEIGLDIVTLGLVYDVAAEGGTLRVTHTLTTPGCPMESVIAYGIEAVCLGVPGVERVERRLVFEPRWEPSMIREGAW